MKTLSVTLLTCCIISFATNPLMGQNLQMEDMEEEVRAMLADSTMRAMAMEIIVEDPVMRREMREHLMEHMMRQMEDADSEEMMHGMRERMNDEDRRRHMDIHRYMQMMMEQDADSPRHQQMMGEMEEDKRTHRMMQMHLMCMEMMQPER